MQELLPSSSRILLSTARPKYKDCANSLEFEHVSHPVWLAAMNAIGRSTARQLQWQLIDVHAMTEMFPSPTIYLRDKHHPNSTVMAETLNIAFNIVAEAQHLQKSKQD